MCVDGQAVGVLEEGIAEIPKLESLVGEILVLYLHQPGLPHSTQILLEAFAHYQIVLYVDGGVEAVFLIQVVQNAEEDDKELLVVVCHPFFVDGIQVHHIVILDESWRVADGACPVDFVVTSMQVLDGEEDKIAVSAVEFNERQDDIQVGFRLVAPTFAGLRKAFVQYGLALGV